MLVATTPLASISVLDSCQPRPLGRNAIFQAQRDFNDIRVGILHLANLIDSVIRLDDESGALTPAKSRVRQLKAAEVAAAKMMAGKPTSANSKDGLGVTRAAGTIFGGSTTISVSDGTSFGTYYFLAVRSEPLPPQKQKQKNIHARYGNVLRVLNFAGETCITKKYMCQVSWGFF